LEALRRIVAASSPSVANRLVRYCDGVVSDYTLGTKLPVSGEQFVQTGQAGLADDLFEYLKDQIAIGNLEPGERLVEEQIAQATAMSRTPVREALRRLKAAGLVDNRGRSFVVISLSSAEQREVWAVLEYLTGMAARLAAVQRTEVDLAGLRMIIEHGHQAAEADDLTMVIDLNRKFHDLVNQASGNRTLAELIANLTLRVERGTDFAQARRRTAAQEEHNAILAALEGKDSDAAEKAAHTHLRHQLVATTMPQITPR
jgi:DNA-binding GntR family transcriptional regulator